MRRPILPLIAVLAVTAVAAGCGDDGDQAIAGNQTDRAFASQMVPHHEGAIEMAALARRRGEHPELRRLAGRIIRAQRAEIEVLRPTEAKLKRADVPMGELGLDEHEMSLGGDVHALRDSDQFDRTFIEMMVPHHESAVRMAAVELRSGKNPRLRSLADAIIAAQRREIDQMEDWFVAWYGEELGSPTQHAG